MRIFSKISLLAVFHYLHHHVYKKIPAKTGVLQFRPKTFAKPSFFLIVIKNKIPKVSISYFFGICKFRGFEKVSLYNIQDT